MLDPATIQWIGDLGQVGLTQAQCTALALMRTGRSITDAQLRQLGLDNREATTALGDLVSRGLAARTGGRRDRSAEVLAIFRPGVSLSLAEVNEQTGLGRAMAARYLERLLANGRLRATAPPKARDRRFHRPGAGSAAAGS